MATKNLESISSSGGKIFLNTVPFVIYNIQLLNYNVGILTIRYSDRPYKWLATTAQYLQILSLTSSSEAVISDPINPIPVNTDEVLEDQVDWDASDFTGWVGNPRDIFGNVNDGGIYNDSSDNPKSFTLRLNRTKKMRDFGIGTNIGNFSNIKASILGSGGADRGLLDNSEDPNKITSFVYSKEEFIINAIKVEFFTSDRVDVTNAFLKYTYSPQKQGVIHKFGLAPDVDPGNDITIFTLNTNYTFTTTPQAYFISSSNAADTQTIEVETIGVNTDGRYQREITEVTLQGQTKVQIPTTLICIASNRAFNIGSVDLLGDVYIYEDTAITNGVPNDLSFVRSIIPIGFNQTRQAVYTVPEFLESGRQVLEFEFYFFIIELARQNNAAGTGSLFVQEKGKVKRELSVSGLSDNNDSEYDFGEDTPLLIPAGSHIWLQVYDITANNCVVSGKFKGSLTLI